MIDLSDENFQILRQILKQYLPNQTIWVFGSRVNGKAKPYSDLDIVIVSDDKTDQFLLYDLQEALSESNLTIRVDLLDWQRLSLEFQQIIQANYQVLDY